MYHRFILGYKPIEIGAAAGYENGPFSVEVGANVELWSRYLDRHGNDWSHATWDPEDDIEQPGWDADWKDPSFDSTLKAFYYARVIEIPTPRWTAYDAKRFNVTVSKEVPMTTQERAYTSPIWYTP